MIISTCGYGNSGSSAVLDFLKGYGNASMARDFEFQLIHMPDGLLDLKYNLVQNRDRLAGNAAILRFLRLSDSIFASSLKKSGCDYALLAEEFINSLCPISWNGKSAFDPADISGIKQNSVYERIRRNVYAIMRRISPDIASVQFKKRYFLALDEEDFDSKAKIFLKKIFSSMGYDSGKDMLFDQLVPAADPRAGTEFIDENKIIVVYRDPVDLFIRANTHQATNAYFPCADVKQFTEYYKMIMKYYVFQW